MKEQSAWVGKSLKKAALEQKANKKAISKMTSSGKLRKQLDQQFQDAHDEVFEKRDCLDCANCCRTTSPIFRDVDVERLSKHLGMKAFDFQRRYLKIDADNDYVLQQAPCPFLGDDHKCSVYDHRPKACREYPHTDRKNMHQIANLTLKNTLVCPAAGEILDRVKLNLLGE